MAEPKVEGQGESCQAYCPFCVAFKAAHEVRAELKRRVPEGFWQHQAAARREGLLALRSLIDAALERTEAKPARKATRIRVE